MTTSAHAQASRACSTSSASSMPGRMDALNRPSMPPPVPPAAPAPGRFSIMRPFSASMASASRARPASSVATCCASAPFCGANTAAAPSVPVRGLVTSHANTIGMFRTSSGTSVSSMRASRGSAPPPNPSTMRSAPASIAARISSPVPKVDAANGSRSAGEMRSMPLAAANSTTAVRGFSPS